MRPLEAPDGVSFHPACGGALRLSRAPGSELVALLTASTFSILVLELALIRWLAGQIRLFAYFNNLVLIAGFLGMGLGVALGKQRPALRHLALPALLALGAVAAAAERIGLTQLSFPDLTVSLWGADVSTGLGRALLVTSGMLALFWAIAGVLLCIGAGVAHFFDERAPLRSYTADLLGSLLGVIAFAGVTAFGTGPPVWLVLGVLPLLAVTPRWWAALCCVGIVAEGAFTVGDAQYSPYNRITLAASGGSLELDVNRDFHQFMHDLSDEAVAAAGPGSARKRWYRAAYDLPFRIHPGARTALVVGGGTGNDVQAALRNGLQAVTAVEIDPRILELGAELHPEHPYSDPRVTRVADDARAFLEHYDGPPFDVICYGLLDSHAMFSALSTLRLENYVYTEEGLRRAWSHVSDGGALAVSFSVFAGDWISDRLYWTLAKATGGHPLVVHHGMHYGRTFVVAKGELAAEGVRGFRIVAPTDTEAHVRTTSDDWPFLYTRPGIFPWGYTLLLGAICATSLVAVRAVFGAALIRGFDLPMFAMGAAFLLLETRSVTTLGLLFGSTWVVNAVVFAGILTTVLVANIAVVRWRPRHTALAFAPLLGSLLLLFWFDVAWLDAFPLVARAVLGGLLVGLPVGLAGVIVSTRLALAQHTTAALGSNLLGAVLGGCVEYSAMIVGLRALVGFAALFYLVALWATLRERSA